MRTVSKHIYIIASILTLFIFLMGMFLGLVIDAKRVNYIQSVSKEQVVDFTSLQLQYQYIDSLGEQQNCDALLKTFETAIKTLEVTRTKLENYDKKTQINKNEYSLLKREYSLAQLKYWFLAQKSSELCDKKISTVMYFFSDEKNCPRCDEQAFVLTYLKKLFKDRLLNFAFDERLAEEEGMIDMLKTTYGMYEYPSLVINGEFVSGFVTTEELLEHICPNYEGIETEVPQCAPYMPQKNETEIVNETVQQ